MYVIHWIYGDGSKRVIIRLKSMKHMTDYLIFTTECIYYSTHESINLSTKSCILMNMAQMIITMYKKYMSIKVQNSFLCIVDTIVYICINTRGTNVFTSNIKLYKTYLWNCDWKISNPLFCNLSVTQRSLALELLGTLNYNWMLILITAMILLYTIR